MYTSSESGIRGMFKIQRHNQLSQNSPPFSGVFSLTTNFHFSGRD